METGSRQFGMCMHIGNEPGGFASHGTMLEVQVSYVGLDYTFPRINKAVYPEHDASAGGRSSYNQTILVVRLQDVSYFPDGRSVVNTMGGRRFKVLSRGMRDGYSTAKVQFIQDVPETEPDALQSKCDRFVVNGLGFFFICG